MRTARVSAVFSIAILVAAAAHARASASLNPMSLVSAQPPSDSPSSPSPSSPAGDKPAPAPSASGSTQPPPPASSSVPPKDPTPEDLIREMEKRAKETAEPPPPAPAPTASRPASAAAAPTVKGASGRVKTRPKVIAPRSNVREGTFIPARRGRVTRGAEGEWLFSFDVDADGNTDAPMILMPCQNLMAIERLAERNGESATYTLSGQVFVYHSRTYLLPTTYMVNRSSDVMPTQ